MVMPYAPPVVGSLGIPPPPWKPYCPFIVRQSCSMTPPLPAKIPPPGTLSLTVSNIILQPGCDSWLMAAASTRGFQFWIVRYSMVTSGVGPFESIAQADPLFLPSMTDALPWAHPPTDSSPGAACLD